MMASRSEEHTSELQSRLHLVCRLLLEKKKTTQSHAPRYTSYRKHLNSLTNFFLYLVIHSLSLFFFFFFNDTATTEIYTLSLHDALPICRSIRKFAFENSS